VQKNKSSELTTKMSIIERNMNRYSMQKNEPIQEIKVEEATIEEIEFEERAKTFVDMYKEFDKQNDEEKMDEKQLDEVE